ncbi:bifunctional acetate--CoA ligase family protein/GNAT family N-acetyltransferase [Actinacidiphila soli]|uniref:bifunctional acetate--CoA ligase family protein/GNAT family N-acetyltransferase n=1 Tax=Actinacidiphila soli TaxID=2487275 RepID=UPI000FCB1A19|nr:GNAT family N-acetyltransferase [Actinacidiphila soli]
MPSAQHLPLAVETPAVEALLADGTTAVIRPLGPDDRDAALDLHAVRMTDESRRLRFFGVSRLAPEMAADRLCVPPRPGFVALGALVGGELVGVVECETIEGRPDTAELAVAVADDWQHRGVATLLIEHLVHAAREQGARTLEADTLVGNRSVHKVFSDLGLRVHRHLAQGEVRVTVDLDESDEHYRNAVDERGRGADIASLVPLLRPGAVAVVGVSRRPGSVGQAVLLKIRQGGFTGEIWAINPYAEEVAGAPAYPALSALPGVPDLAVIAVRPTVVASAAEECGLAGVRALVVLTSGLDGKQARQLLDTCRRHSMRLVGPNCLGIAQTDPAYRLDAEFGRTAPLPGTAGVAVQSGGVGIALLERLSGLGVGVSTFVSLGDKYDVSGNDLLQWWESDGCTDLALLHLESFGSPRAFSRTARRVSRRMPVLTVDAGRSAAGRRGAATHTAAAATPTVTRQALFTQAGITATRSIGELVETAALLHAQPLPGVRDAVAVVSNAGGVGILAADACSDVGLSLPALPAPLVAELLAVLPAGATATNPVDTTAAVDPKELRACLDLLERGGSVEAVLVCLTPTALATDPEHEPLRALVSGRARGRIPVAVVLLDQDAPVRYLDTADGGRIPSYADPSAAARALAHARDRARWLAEPAGIELPVPGCDPQRANAVVDGFLAAHPRGGWLDPDGVAALLECYGVPLTTSIWAEDEHMAVLAASSLGQLGHEGRVALKAYWPEQVHKSEVGAVRTGVDGEHAVRAAFRDFSMRFGERMAGVVVQPMAGPGMELFAGVVQDVVFGPLVMFGMGGTTTDVLDDRVARLAPLTSADVHAMTTGLRATPLLFGYHGGAAVNLTAVQDVLARVSHLAMDLPQLTEADLNPLIAGPQGVLCVDARIRLEPRHPFDPYLRRLRRPIATEPVAA